MNQNIKCPNCFHQFDVEEALSIQLRKEILAEYKTASEKSEKKLELERKKLILDKKAFDEKKAKENELFHEKLTKNIAVESKKIEKAITEKYELQLKLLEDENIKRKDENRKLRLREITLLKKENELNEAREDFKVTLEKEILEKQTMIEEKARKKERESFELERLKLLKQIDDNKKLAEEMKRKAEQGSSQLQGEVQELALEDLLKQNFVFDRINEVPKGIKGADILQTVIDKNQNNCGTIIFESKRTKNFDAKWLGKLKQDQITAKSHIAVLVTATYPRGLERFDCINGVWVCTFSEVGSLVKVLREILIEVNLAKVAEDHKGDKMALLYKYLTGNDFVQKIKRIIEVYDEMADQLNREKKNTFRIWKEREKQIWVVQENLNSLFGDIRGIAGNAIPPGALLTLKDPEIN